MDCAEMTASLTGTLSRNITRPGQLIYFDTNVFDPKSGFSDAQMTLIKSMCDSPFRLVFGFDGLEEALIGLDSAKPEALEHVRRILDWPDPRLVAKPVDMLLPDDIVRYSKGQRLSPWLENPPLATVQKKLRDLRPLAVQQLKREFAAEIDKIRERRDHYVRSFEQTIHELSSDPFILANRRTSFPEFYRLTSLHVAESCVRRTEHYVHDTGLLDRCRERGIEGLLNILSVQLATIVTLSLLHAQLLNEGRQTAKARPGDLADMRHAVVASSADVFVTNDERQFKRLSSVPTGKWRVIWLKSLVECGSDERA
jgi:hypothetical protein